MRVPKWAHFCLRKTGSGNKLGGPTISITLAGKGIASPQNSKAPKGEEKGKKKSPKPFERGVPKNPGEVKKKGFFAQMEKGAQKKEEGPKKNLKVPKGGKFKLPNWGRTS